MGESFNGFKRFVGLLAPALFSFIPVHAQNAYLQGCIEGAQNDSIQLEWINEAGTDWEKASAQLNAKGCFQLRLRHQTIRTAGSALPMPNKPSTSFSKPATPYSLR